MAIADESSWRTCRDPAELLRLVRPASRRIRPGWLAEPTTILDGLSDAAAERKLRLLACACCRRIWKLLLHDEAWTAAVTMAEREAEDVPVREPPEEDLYTRLDACRENGAARHWYAGCAGVVAGYWCDEWGRRRGQIGMRSMPEPSPYAVEKAVHAAGLVALAAAYDAVAPTYCASATSSQIVSGRLPGGSFEGNPFYTLSASGFRNTFTRDPAWQEARNHECSRQAELVRDVFGNPFRAVRFDPDWLSWHEGTIERLALAAYEERQLPSGELDGARLAVLADALEEAGCSDAEILGHLRNPGLHVRGCWAVDLLLSKDR